jgi:hypothetical protein
MSLSDPLLHRPVSVLLLLLLSLVVDILECTVYVLVYLRILTSPDVIPMPRREHMMHVVLEGLFANRAEQMVESGSRLFDHGRVLFLRCFLPVQVLQIFVVLIFEVVEVLLRVLSLIGQGEEGCA